MKKSIEKRAFDVWAKMRLIELGRDQKELAEEMELHPSQVNKIIHGQRKLNLDEFPTFARFFKVSTDELFEAMGIEVRPRKK